MKSILLTLGLAELTAWLWAVILVGRAIPWQATREWAVAFAVGSALSAYWWWRFLSRVDRRVSWSRHGMFALLLGSGPFLAATTAVLGMAYFSDQFNGLLERPNWRMQVVAGTALAMIVVETAQLGSLLWLEQGCAKLGTAFLKALSVRADLIVLITLSAIGAVLAVARTAPVGDDIWHYTAVADALTKGLPYPIPPVEEPYLSAGMAAHYPALPALPILLALSFSLAGHNLVGVALPLVTATALFPLALFAICKSITGSRLAAYSVTLLLFLFPVYRIHALGTPEPDTLFVTLLLLGAAVAARASNSNRRETWAGMGVVMGFASLTRQEGIAYSAVLFAMLLLVRGKKATSWLSLATYLAVLAPFVAVHYSLTKSFWPATFVGAMHLDNVGANLSMLRWTSLPWYAQAVGVEKEAVIGLLWLAGLGSVLGTVALWRKKRELAFIPIAGMGNIAAGFFINPVVMLTYSPVEFFRHVSFGIPYVAVTLGYVAHLGYRHLSGRFPTQFKSLFLAFVVLLICAGIYYDSERLARPEWYFEGRWTLLWTGTAYTLPDLLQNPVALPDPNDTRAYGEIWGEKLNPLEGVSLHRVNRSEPYHWTSMMLAMFGLLYSASPLVDGLRNSRSAGRNLPLQGSLK